MRRFQLETVQIILSGCRIGWASQQQQIHRRVFYEAVRKIELCPEGMFKSILTTPNLDVAGCMNLVKPHFNRVICGIGRRAAIFIIRNKKSSLKIYKP